MTNTITKITYDGDEYKVGAEYTAGTGISITSNEIANTGVTSFNGNTGTVTYTAPVTSVNGSTGAVTVSAVPAVGTNGQVLTVVSGAAAWATPSGGDVLVSDQANNIFTSGMKIWGGTEADYLLLTPDSNTAYLLTAGTPTPTPPFTPGANTICYYPLDSDFVDASGNCSDIVPNSASPTIGLYHGVNCFSLNGDYSTVSTIDDLNGKSNYTWSFRLYNVDKFCMTFNVSGDWGGSGPAFYTSNQFEIRWGNTSNTRSIISNLAMNTWFHLAITLNNGTASYYVNGVETVIGTGFIAPNHNATPLTINETYDRSGDNTGYGFLSELIIEDKAWSAQEISDYYDQTKGDYGIS